MDNFRLNVDISKKIAFFMLTFLIVTQSAASGSVKQQKLTAIGGGTFDRFGWAVSISADGNTMAVGAPFRDIVKNTDQGSVCVFSRTAKKWVQEKELTASDGLTLDRFGWAVSVNRDGNILVVGAPYVNVGGRSEQGAAYVFVRKERRWIQEAKLLAPDGAAGDRFGWSVLIDGIGERIVIGAPLATIGRKSEQGAVHEFVRNNGQWMWKYKLTISDGAVDDHFGHSVSISGAVGLVAAGAPEYNNGRNTSQGAVYMLSASPFFALTERQWIAALAAAAATLWFVYYTRNKRRSLRAKPNSASSAQRGPV